MDILGALASPFQGENLSILYITMSIVVMLVVILVLYKTYRASLNVEARLAEFSSLTSDPFANRLKLIETNADEFRINKRALGPLAKIIDEYCVFTTDVQGHITYANEKFLALSEHRLHDLIGKHQSITRVRGGDSDDDMQRTLSEDKVWHGELCNRSRSGQPYWVDVFVFPLSYLSEEERGYIYFGTDITAIKKLNSQLLSEVRKKEEAISKVENMLLHSEKMASLGVISAGIAHEINTPLAFVASNVRRLTENVQSLTRAVETARDLAGEQALCEALQAHDSTLSSKELAYLLEDTPQLTQETHDGVERIQKIISDLKCFSHEGQDAFSAIDIHHCIESALNLARHETRHGIEVVRQFDDREVRICGSEPQLSQVFVNLVVNAAQALDGKGKITIATRANRQHFSIKVTDNGPGIPAEVLDSIFEPFFTTKGVGKGTGLGLAISQDIIKRHKGSISVASKPGVGTAFLIQLPLSEALPGAAQ
ncbi:sensor histidine kinase [Isoalcanivorax indicus]|uniref:sensor histidine kinase n=1 Tax=Isoalcanivorax indicus TaxID=2202653 RepID=UPI000DB91C52|nr:ATP-binding protein [Isoalcanivorax indicus]